MSRSLKKGPYISVKLDKKVAAMEASGKQYTMVINLFPYMLPKTWWGTNSVSSLLHAHSAAMQVTRKNKA